MEQIPETQLKLRDAGNQMNLALSNWGDEDIFRSCVNSYISHARSVTFVMQRESSGNPELVEWYEKQMENLKQLPIMKFFNEQRVHIIHRGIVKPLPLSFPVDDLTVDGVNLGRGTVSTYGNNILTSP